MKQTTNQIYNLITNVNFEDIQQKLINKVYEHNWNIPERQEYSYEELLQDLPDSIDIIKQHIEADIFDNLTYNVRHQILQIINQLNSILANIYNNHQQFAQLQDQTQSLLAIIRTNRLDFEAKRIPRYKEKIKEYKELIAQLQEVNSTLNTTEEKRKELVEVLSQSQDALNTLEKYAEQAKEKNEDIDEKLNSASEEYNQINAMQETIKEQKDNILAMLQEAKASNVQIKDIETEVENFQEKISELQEGINSFIEQTKKDITSFMSKTDEIIQTNAKQQEEIDNQLQKAVGASLFSTFSKRKEELGEKLNYWLGALAFVLFVLIVLSGWIAYDIVSIDTTNWYKVGIKIAISFPLIYMLIFLSGRYKKERRLLEEYAFKSTLSLALTPYAELIKKIEEEGADSKYRDFLITSIENIFSVPTERAFGDNKGKQEINYPKIVDEVLSRASKLKKAAQDII